MVLALRVLRFCRATRFFSSVGVPLNIKMGRRVNRGVSKRPRVGSLARVCNRARHNFFRKTSLKARSHGACLPFGGGYEAAEGLVDIVGVGLGAAPVDEATNQLPAPDDAQLLTRVPAQGRWGRRGRHQARSLRSIKGTQKKEGRSSQFGGKGVLGRY